MRDGGKMKKKIVITAVVILLVPLSFLAGLYLQTRKMADTLLPWDSPDANILTMHTKCLANGTVELNYLPTSKAHLSEELQRRQKFFHLPTVCIWSEDGATFRQLYDSIIVPLRGTVSAWELRFMRNGRIYRVPTYPPLPDARHGLEKCKFHIDSSGRVVSGDLVSEYTSLDQFMTSLQATTGLTNVHVLIVLDCPMGIVFDILASAADHGMKEITITPE